MSKLTYTILAIVTVAACEAPLGNELCTLAGCDSNYLLLINAEDDSTSQGDYSIVLTQGEEQIACSFTLAETGNACIANDCIENRVCDALNGIYYSGSEEKLYLFYPPLEGELNIEIEQNGKPLVGLRTRPLYEQSYPNGPDCEPTCYNATSEIAVSR